MLGHSRVTDEHMPLGYVLTPVNLGRVSRVNEKLIVVGLAKQCHFDCPTPKLPWITTVIIIVWVEYPSFNNRIKVIHPLVITCIAYTFHDDRKKVFRPRPHHRAVLAKLLKFAVYTRQIQ